MKRPVELLAPVLVALALAGCGSDSKSTAPKVVDPLPSNTVLNDSPTHTITRLEATLEYKSPLQYAALLSGDFRFQFSADTDPVLVAQFGDTWNAWDDSSSISHLIRGFTPTAGGAHVPAASSISIMMSGVSEIDDSTHPDSIDVYRVVLVSSCAGMIEVPATPEPFTYSLAGTQAFYLVRGDVAVLRPGQTASADRWYLRRWEDRSTYPLLVLQSRGGPTTNPSPNQSWGKVKALYLE